MGGADLQICSKGISEDGFGGTPLEMKTKQPQSVLPSQNTLSVVRVGNHVLQSEEKPCNIH